MELKVAMESLQETMQQLNTVNNDIYNLERRLESRPSQVELNQYQRRFMELYNQGSIIEDISF